MVETEQACWRRWAHAVAAALPGRVAGGGPGPFARFNLRCNPFGELPNEERAALAVVDVEEVAGRLASPVRLAVQYMGDKGRGKTTHLLALLESLKARPSPRATWRPVYVHLPEEGPLPAIPRGDPLLIDEAQRLPRWRRRWVLGGRRGLALGTHEDLGSLLRRAGFEVLREEPARELTPMRLQAIVRKRLEWARRSPGELPAIPHEVLTQLCARFGDDVRSMEHALYEVFQNLTGLRHGAM
jgi:hypothetical protein